MSELHEIINESDEVRCIISCFHICWLTNIQMNELQQLRCLFGCTK